MLQNVSTLTALQYLEPEAAASFCLKKGPVHHSLHTSPVTTGIIIPFLHLVRANRIFPRWKYQYAWGNGSIYRKLFEGGRALRESPTKRRQTIEWNVKCLLEWGQIAR